MEPASGRSQARKKIEVRIADLIEIKAGSGLGHAPGIVAVLDSKPGSSPRNFVGASIRITTAGSTLAARIAEAKDHGPSLSVFLLQSREAHDEFLGGEIRSPGGATVPSSG